MTPRLLMAGRGKRVVWSFESVTFPNEKKTLSCKASTCSYAIRDNITRFETHIRSCEKAQAEFRNLFLRLGENPAVSGDIGGSSRIGVGLGPLSAEEHADWQKQCCQLMFEDGLPFSTFDSGKWREFFLLTSGGLSLGWETGAVSQHQFWRP